METKSSVGHVPAKDRWEFDASVTDVFDDMLARSIPQYQVMRRACLDIAARHVLDGTTVIDLGCSRGEALSDFLARFGARVSYLGIEVSPPMLEAARARFSDVPNIVRIADHDLRRDLTLPKSSVVLSVLTLMFVPVNHRQRVLHRVWQSLVDGGALVLVEKVLGASAGIDERMVHVYHQMKTENGYSDEEVRRKAMALEGVLVPMTAGMNEDLLRGAGFRSIDCFWRWMNFAGWIAVK